MNLFAHVKLFGCSKGFVGTVFFSSEFDVLKCAVCGVALQDISRVTCSVLCSEKYRKITKIVGVFYRGYGQEIRLRDLNREEFVLFMREKYGVEK